MVPCMRESETGGELVDRKPLDVERIPLAQPGECQDQKLSHRLAPSGWPGSCDAAATPDWAPVSPPTPGTRANPSPGLRLRRKTPATRTDFGRAGLRGCGGPQDPGHPAGLLTVAEPSQWGHDIILVGT